MYVYKILNFQYFAYLMQTIDSLEKSLMVRKIEDRKSRGHHRMRWLDCIIDAMDMNLGKLWQIVRDKEAWHALVHGITKSDMTGQLNNSVYIYIFATS